jgi:hypothetical protein
VPSAVAEAPEAVAAPADPSAVAAAVQAGGDLAHALVALRASTDLLSGRSPALASSVAANLIRAEAWRASCLLQASRFLRGELVAASRPVRAQAIVDQVLKSIEPERRLRSITLDERIDLGQSTIAVDEDLLVSALSGLLMATLALSEEQPSFAVTISAESRGSEITFAIVQPYAEPPSNWSVEWPVVSAARIVAAFKGRLVMIAAQSGTDVRVVVPRFS